MNDLLDSHTPSPEFRAALERDLVGALRRETRFAPYNRIARGARVRSVMLIVIGAVLGVGCGFASAQVRESQARSELLMAAEASLKLASLRLEMARTSLAESRKQFDVGVIARKDLLAFETEARAMELNLARVNLDMEEIRASAASPRDELWAPLIGGRDFVKQRLDLQAARVQQQLTAAEAGTAELERSFNAGTVGRITLQEARTRLLESQQELASLAERLALRRQFIDEKLSAEELGRRLQIADMERTLNDARQQSQVAEWRAQLSRERYKIGSGSEIEVKRAELELLELQFRIQQLTLQLKAFQSSKRSP